MTPEIKARLDLAKVDKDWAMKIVDDWKWSWMNQKQNDQADYENYHRRAFGVDANMKHSLAMRIVDAVRAREALLEARTKKLVEALGMELRSLVKDFCMEAKIEALSRVAEILEGKEK